MAAAIERHLPDGGKRVTVLQQHSCSAWFQVTGEAATAATEDAGAGAGAELGSELGAEVSAEVETAAGELAEI